MCQAAAHGELTSLCRVPRALAHDEGRGLPCAYRVTHGEVLVGGPGGSILRRVLGPAAHDKGWSVRRVPPSGTRRIVVTLPCAKPTAHDKVTRNNLFFFVFSRLKYPLKPYIIDHIS